MTLSIVIPTHNDTQELIATVRSIRATAGFHPEIVVVDDLSDTSVERYLTHLDGITLVTNRARIGVGASRHIGAVNASSDVLLFVDSHMRFTEGWYENAMRRVEGRPHTLHCATCLGLDERHMDPLQPQAVYEGATINMFGPDLGGRGAMQVLEVVWHLKNGRTEPKVDDCELPAIMGACYFMPRLWYLELAPLKNLRAWGCDELSLSLSAWLSGGDVRFMRNVRIGHKFNSGKVPMWQQFGIDPHWPVWNKLFGIKTLLFPDTVSEKYERLLWAHTTADIQNRLMILLRNHLHTIETTRAENRKRFKRDMAWFCGKFGLPL